MNCGKFSKAFKVANLDVGSSTYLRMNNILAVHWKDNRDVFVLSSIHGNKEETIQRHIGENSKPTMIQCYSMKMGRVVKCDQRLSYYSKTQNRKG